MTSQFIQIHEKDKSSLYPVISEDQFQEYSKKNLKRH